MHADDAKIVALSLKAQKANTIAVIALGRIRNDGLTAAEAAKVADQAVRDMKAMLEA